MTGEFSNIVIQGIASAVPTYEENNSKYEKILGKRQLKRQTRITGASRRRISGKFQRSSDLCYGAAVPLMKKLNWKPEEIKVLIMVTQRPNYVFPSTAFLLQKQLGIPKDCIVFDINLGCSSFPVGVQVVSSLLQLCKIHDKGLLLLADTVKSLSYPECKIKKNVITHNMLFGSAGAAVALEKVDDTKSLMFMSKSDGNSFDAIIQRFGVPANMDGGKVFDFAINDVSKDIIAFRDSFRLKESDIDYYVFHQAQNMILDTIDDACDIAKEKELRSIEEFGNTSGVSIPMSICANRNQFENKKSIRVLCCGFGVGLSWGSIFAEINTENILPIIETDEHYEDDKVPVGELKEKTVVVFNADTPMGECLSRYLSNQSAEILMVGDDKEKLREIQKDLYTASYVYEGVTVNIADMVKQIYEFEYEYPIHGIVFASDDDKSDEIREVFGLLNKDEEMKNRVIIVKEKSHYDSLIELIEELEEEALSEKLCVNGIIYDKNKIDLVQSVHEGREWVDEFLQRGCPDEMKRQFHIALGVRFLLSDAGQFTSGTVLRMER